MDVQALSTDIFKTLLMDRIYSLYGEITIEQCAMLTSLITIWNSSADPSPIKIFINSPGGILSESMAIADFINISQIPITTVAVGQAASGGFFIFVAGHKRLIFPNTELMVHSFSIDPGMTSFSDMKSLVNFRVTTEQKLTNFLKAKTKLTKDIYEKIFQKQEEIYFTAEEAIKYGIADEIVRRPL